MNDMNATLQLKGMLGMVSSSGGAGSGNGGKSKTDNAPTNTSKLTPNNKAPKKYKDKNTKKKNRKKDQANSTAKVISESENNVNTSNSKASMTKSGKKKKKKKNGVEGPRHSNLHHSQSSNSVAPTCDNKFACSSLFIAPDASNLPIPSFGSIDLDTSEQQQGGQPSTNKNSSYGTDVAVTQTVETLERQFDAVDINGREITSTCNLADEGEIEVEDLGQSISMSRESKLPCSASGVNLADAATTSNSSKPRTPQVSSNINYYNQQNHHQHTQLHVHPSKESSDPLTMLMNPSYGSAANSTLLPSPYQHMTNGNYSMHMNPSMASPSRNTAITGPQGFQSPYQHQLHGQLHHLANVSPSLPVVLSPQYTLHPQQNERQFVTFQVQVPSTLLPGRQMMVPTPSGYKYPVIVPNGIRAGHTIPVQIPIMHMHSMNSKSNMACTEQHKLQQQQHTRPTVVKKNNEPAPGTWAAKAAAAGVGGGGRNSSSNCK